jgi:periplasmic protein TonB
MKTNVKVTAMPVTGSFDELIFNNRNKAYGAYELRKKYNKRLLIGFVFAFSIFGTAVCVPLLESYFGEKGVGKSSFNENSITLTTINNIDPPKPPTPPEAPKGLSEVARFRPIQVIAEEVDSTQTVLITDDALIHSVNEHPVDANPSVPDDYTPEIDEKPLVVITEPAQFNGGDISNFSKWVNANISFPPEILSLGISGRLILQFVVDKTGTVCAVKVLRSVHPELDKEVVRTILNSPKWTAPKQNGRPVKQLFTLPVLFKIQD